MSGIVGKNLGRGSGLVKVGSVGADSVTGASIADDAIDSEHYTNASIDNAHLADNAVDTDEIADNAVSLAKMAGGTDGQIITYDASGNPTAVGPGSDGEVLTSTGAGSPPAFEAASGGTNTPYFLAYCSGNQTGNADNATVDVEFDAEIYDSAGEFNTTTYKWTPTTAGYYWIEAQIHFASASGHDLNEVRLYIDVSGTLKFYQAFSNYDAPFNYGSFKAGGIYYLSGSNYVDVRAGADTNGTTWTRGGSGTSYMMSYFQGWKLLT